MTKKTPVKKTPVTRSKQTKHKADTGKLRPKKEPDAKVRHAVWSLHDLLQGDLDQRLAIAKKLAGLEAWWTEYAGGVDVLTPPMVARIKWIAAASLVIDQGIKMAALKKFNLADHNYLAVFNARERAMDKLDIAIAKNFRRAKSLEDYIEAKESKP